MRLNPVNNCVVVRPTQLKMQDDAFFCSQQNNDLQLGVVEASSFKEICKNYTVIFYKYSASSFTLDGKNYLLVNGDDILACLLEDCVNEK